MKRVYTQPVAREELFMANNYVAGCQISTKSTSTQNKMRCIIPWHTNYDQYFTSVWVAASATNCAILVTDSTTKTNTQSGAAYQPLNGATVYGSDGTPYTCNIKYKNYYLPFDKNSVCSCVGSYVNNGTYSEISEKVNS